MNAAPKRAIVFDLDGTLIDSAGAVAGVASRFMAEIGLAAVTIDQAHRYVGRGAPTFLERALQERSAYDPERFDAHLARFRTLYAEGPPEDNPPYPGADAALKSLSEAGWALGLCTNKPLAPTQKILDWLGWTALFGVVIGGDSLPVRKPDPAPLRACFDALAAPSALFVGDSETDMLTAEAAGAPFLLHTKGYHNGKLAELRAAARFERLADLPALAESAGSFTEVAER